MCYSHPNGQQSLLKYPNVICGSGEHGGMLAVGVFLLVVGVFGFLALCTFAAFQVPHWSARELHHRVRCFRFLVFRFRLDSWWMGVPLLCRGPLISLPIVLFTDFQAIQSMLVTTILCAFLVTQCLAWPWKARRDLIVQVSCRVRLKRWLLSWNVLLIAAKVPLLNALDCWMSFSILILVAGTALYVGPVAKGPHLFRRIILRHINF